MWEAVVGEKGKILPGIQWSFSVNGGNKSTVVARFQIPELTLVLWLGLTWTRYFPAIPGTVITRSLQQVSSGQRAQVNEMMGLGLCHIQNLLGDFVEWPCQELPWPYMVQYINFKILKFPLICGRSWF